MRVCVNFKKGKLLLFLWLFAVPLAIAKPAFEDNWRIWRQQNGVTVSYQAVENSDALAIKAQIDISHRAPEQVLNYISQVDYIQQWMAFLEKADVIAHHGQTELTTLFEFEAVWPLSERQMVLSSEFQFTDTGFQIISVDQQEKYAHLLDKTIVSVPYSKWQLIETTDNQNLSLIYTSVTRLNGDAPVMLSNKMVLRSMWQSFKKLKLLIVKDSEL